MYDTRRWYTETGIAGGGGPEILERNKVRAINLACQRSRG